MAPVSPIIFEDPPLRKQAARILRRLPVLTGRPIRVKRAAGLRDRHGAVHAGSFLRRRLILVDCPQGGFSRILVHELFHFAWLRLGNARRLSFEELLRNELDRGARGELGWSAEWRKIELSAGDAGRRTRRWREYCCEAFCDSAAWLFAGIARHKEFTLPERCRARRRKWFAETIGGRGLSI